MIISLLNQKGGVGKTTLAVHIATALARRAVLDWAASRQGASLVPVVGLPTKTLHKEIQAHTQHYDDIVIDGPPRVHEIARAAIIAADVVLISVQPSPYDVWAAKEIVDLLSEASVFP